MTTKSANRRMKDFHNAPIITAADVRQAMLDARNDLSDKQVFTSSVYQTKLNAFARFITGRTGKAGTGISVSARVEWNAKDKDMTAYTDGLVAVINAACEPIHEHYKRRLDKHYAIMGLAVHEFAHCLFTDFTLVREQCKAFMDGRFYPYEPDTTPENKSGLEGMKELLAKGKATRRAIAKLYKNLDNSIEDTYIEKSLARLFPGDAKKALNYLNRALFGGDFMENVKKSYEKAKESGGTVSKWALLHSAMLTMMMIGTVNLDTSYNDDIADVAVRLNRIIPRLKRETENSDHKARKVLCLDIILENWDIIEDDLKHQMDVPRALKDLSPEEAQALLELILGMMLESAGADHERTSDPNHGTPLRVFVELPPDVKLPELPQNSDAGDADVELVVSGGSGQDGNSQDSPPNGTSGSGPDEASSEADSPGNTGETVTIEFGEDEEVSDSGDTTLADSLNVTENELAETRAESIVENQLQQILQDNATAGKATNDHWNIKINRVPVTAYGTGRYETVWPLLRGVSKTLKKELLKILQDRRTGTRVTGLPFGRRMDPRSYSRMDERWFAKNNLPNDTPRVAATLLIDRSGSMKDGSRDSSGQHLFGTKIQAASNTALVLYDFCVDLGFPVMVCSHYVERGKTVVIDSMAAFQRVDKQDRYRIAGAEAGGGNRDGTALNYALGELKLRTEDIKLLFIISDGLPSDYDYGENGIQHLQEVIDDARRSDVFVFAAALDEDIPAIKHIYGDNMFEMTDLAKMPKTLLNVMRRFLK